MGIKHIKEFCGVLESSRSNISMHTNHLGNLLKCRFWCSRCRVRLEILHFFLSFFLFFKDFYNLLLERGEARERNTDVREKHQSVASSTCPDWGPNLQPRYVPWPGIELVIFCFVGVCSSQLSHTGQRAILNSYRVPKGWSFCLSPNHSLISQETENKTEALKKI